MEVKWPHTDMLKILNENSRRTDFKSWTKMLTVIHARALGRIFQWFQLSYRIKANFLIMMCMTKCLCSSSGHLFCHHLQELVPCTPGCFVFMFSLRYLFWASQVALVVKNLPANAGDARDWTQGYISESGTSPGEGHGNHSSILAWRNPWTEEPGRSQSIGLQRVRHDWSALAKSQTRLKCLGTHHILENEPIFPYLSS